EGERIFEDGDEWQRDDDAADRQSDQSEGEPRQQVAATPYAIACSLVARLIDRGEQISRHGGLEDLVLQIEPVPFRAARRRVRFADAIDLLPRRRSQRALHLFRL